MNVELTRKALEKVGNPHVLVNIISRRVRQLNSGGGGISRPLVEVDPTMGIADIALTELIHEKIGFQLDDESPAAEDKAPESSRRKRRVRSLTT
jgi:DNA-directed RNA polymerase subunit omega